MKNQNAKILLALCAGSFFAAQAFAVNGAQYYTPVVNETGLLTLHTSSVPDASILGVGLNYNMAVDPAEYGTSYGRMQNYLHSLNLGVDSKFAERLHAFADFSAHLLGPIGGDLDAALGADGDSKKFVFGNVEIGAGYTIVDNSAGGLGFALIPHLVFPVGSKNFYLDGPRNSNGQRTFQYGGEVAIDYRLHKTDIAVLNLGYDRRNTENFFTWGFGYERVLWSADSNLIVEIRGEQNLDTDHSYTSGPLYLASTDPLEADIDYKGYLGRRCLSYTIGVGRGFNDDLGSPDLRVILGINWQWAQPQTDVGS